MYARPIDILLVEDDPDHAELTIMALQDNQVINKIHWVKDGEEALDFLYHRGKYQEVKHPGLIILDLKLPKVDGLEVLHQIKSDASLKLIPVIILTTSSRDEDIAKAYQDGVNSYITKPVDFKEFTQKIKEIKLYWVLTNTPSST